MRRYVHGTFEDHGPKKNTNYRNSYSKNTTLGHASTLGADYYVKKVNNPLFGAEVMSSCRCCPCCGCKQKDSHNTGDDFDINFPQNRIICNVQPVSLAMPQYSHHPIITTTTNNPQQKLKVHSEKHMLLQLWDTVGKERPSPLQFLNHRTRKKYRSSFNNSHHSFQFFLSPFARGSDKNNWHSSNSYNNDAHNQSYSHNHTLVSNYLPNNNQAKKKTCIYKNNHVPNSKYDPPHPLQKNQLIHNIIRNADNNANNNTPMKNALLQNIDACMLVYDATSSMSFLQLMVWHEELVRRLGLSHDDDGVCHNSDFEDAKAEYHHAERQLGIGGIAEDVTKDLFAEKGISHEEERIKQKHTRQTINDKGHNATGVERNKRRCIPFIVVANKIDLLEDACEGSGLGEGEFLGSNKKQQHSNTSKRRSVMGFTEGSYTGKDLNYEYTALGSNCKAVTSACSRCNGMCCCHSYRKMQCQCHPCQNIYNKRNYRALNPSLPSDHFPNESHSSLIINTERKHNKLTYSLKNTTWTTDTSYLHSLQLAEDQLPANRPMILLWCQRNGIPHVEASALEGRGVDEAMEQLIRMGVVEFEETEVAQMKIEINENERLGEHGSFRARPKMESYINGISSKNIAYPATNEIFHADNANNEAGILSTTIKNSDSICDEQKKIPTSNANTTNNKDSNTDSASTNTHPSQYYYLYQPRSEEKLDLFARYSPKDEKKCFPFQCWWSLFSRCRR